jgi:ATP-dependent DNA helicase RecG
MAQQSKQLTFDDIPPEQLIAEGKERLLSPDEIFRLADESLLKQLGESRMIERKPATFSGDDLGQYICMWANTAPDGGVIVSGMQDKGGKFDGCMRLSQKQVNQLESCYLSFCPDARIESRHVHVINQVGEPDFVVLTRVYYSGNRVVRNSKEKVFKRVGDSCTEIKGVMLKELEEEKGIYSFEKQEATMEYPGDFRIPEIRKFVDIAREAMRYSSALTENEVLELRQLGRLKDGQFKPNVACALLFAKNPRSLIPGCRVHFKRFEDTQERTGKEYNPVKDDVYEGTVSELIAQTSAILESQLRVYRPMNSDGKFFPISEYPYEAWLEAIVNACVHRSYGNGMRNIPIYVKMFDDRLEVESPGPFPPTVTPENIYWTHNPRNPHLMDALRLLGVTRMSHEGCKRIKDSMLKLGLTEPTFEQDNRNNIIVRVTLKNSVNQRRAWIDHDVSKLVSDAVAVALSEDEKRILNYLAEHDKVSISDAARLIESTWETANNILIGLVRKTILQYIRFKPYMKDVRDGKAFFRLRSNKPLPPLAFEQKDLDKLDPDPYWNMEDESVL